MREAKRVVLVMVTDIIDVSMRHIRNTQLPIRTSRSPIANKTFIGKIGAKQNWTSSNSQMFNNVFSTGDDVRNFTPDLEAVINAGVRTVLYDGDADFIVNYKGVEAVLPSCVGRGHEVPAYNYTGLAIGQAVLQFFDQAMRGEQLSSV
ncbi:hypothetical protein ACEPAI_7498 [Sanghuangporus weigelae]